MAHDDEWLLKKILKLLDSSLNDIYLHLDRKFDVNVNEIKNNGGCGQNLGPYGYPADKFGVRIPLDCLYSRGLIPPRESLIRFSQYQCRY